MPSRKKSSRVISADDIDRVFNAACIEQLALIGRLPANADVHRFGKEVREAARIYVRDSGIPNANELHGEISELHRAAERRQFEKVAELLERLSPRARNLLNNRGSRPSLKVEVPATKALHSEERRDQACATIVRLCAFGGRYVEGRMRPSGRRSWTWRPELLAPKPRSQPPRREAELFFLIWLRSAWLVSAGEPASLGANPHRLGPFNRMVKECLRLVGASHVDTAGLINKLNRRSRLMEERSPSKRPLSGSNSRTSDRRKRRT